MKNPIIAALEQQQMRTDLPKLATGCTVVVELRVTEGTKERIQNFEGIVIAVRKRGFNSSFTVRKISHGEGVERVFPMYSTLIKSVQIKRYGDVRKSKLYYLRDRSGKAARLKEKLISTSAKDNPLPQETASE